MSIYKEPTQDFVSTTLNGSINDSVDSIVLNDASKMQYPGYVIIDREDGNGTSTPSAREIVSYTGITGNTLTGCTRGANDSTARSHSDGALVEATITVGMWSGLREAFTDTFGDSGTEFNVSNATISQVTHLTRIVGTSIASISRVESKFINGIQMALSSIASVPRAEFNYVNTKQMALSSAATISQLNVVTSLCASGASLFGVSSGYNVLFQVPGSLASYKDVSGIAIMPSAGAISELIGYVKTPSSISSIAAYVVKQGGTVMGMINILGGATYGSSASIANSALIKGDNLTLDIRSTASSASDLSILMRVI